MTKRLAPDAIDPDADKVVRRLTRHGHKAYLVGGCVRDLLLGRDPKDFDVATSATPNEVKQLFRNCRIIGRRFRLAHIFFGSKIIETSTFRANPRDDDDGEETDELLIRRDNVFGTETEDARRRDFTINGLFYDVETEEVIDHVGGMADLDARVVRTIGDPDIRFQEDPVRMLRAIKFAARLDFDIEEHTYAALLRQRLEIIKCAPPRLLEEVYRLLRGGAARKSMELLLSTGVASILTTQLASMFSGDAAGPTHGEAAPPPRPLPEDPEEARWVQTWSDAAPPAHPPAPAALDLTFIEDATELTRRREVAWNVLDELDRLVRDGEQPSNALLLAAIANPFFGEDLLQAGVRPTDANDVILEVMHPLLTQLRVARRDAERARQIIISQRRLVPSRRRRGRPTALMRRDYFHEALILYEITARAAGQDTADIERWRELEDRDADGEDGDGRPRRRRRRRGGRRRRRGEDGEVDDGAEAAGDRGAAASS